MVTELPVLYLLFPTIVLSLFVLSSSGKSVPHVCAKKEEECTPTTRDDVKHSYSSIKLPSSSSSIQRRRVTVYEPKCVYYLAPSSISNSGFGIFTARDIRPYTFLMQQADAPSIVVSDIQNHTKRNKNRKFESNMMEPLAVHKNYYWDGKGLANFEVDGHVEDSVPTFGALTNYHSFLFNVEPTVEEMDDSIIPRVSGSPGIGSYSYNMGYNFVANRFITQGEELFTSYGEQWLDKRSYCEKVPRQKDYFIAAHVIKEMISTGIQNQNIDGKIVYEQAILSFSSTPVPLEDFIDIFNEFASKSSTESSNNDNLIATALARKSLTPRSVEWIISEGKCLDHLVPDVSTLKDAGRGAFAQRFIPKGAVVVPAPVIQIAEASELYMYDFDTNERIGTQLLMNYCFAHPNTTLLFCPQTNAIVINHCSTRNLTSFGGDCDRYNSNQDETKRGPNAFVRWATSWDPDTAIYLNASLNEILNKTSEGKRVLTMEFIAFRDIHPGDEVFIDYGVEWDKAWAHHVQKWIPPSSINYVPVKEMNHNVVNLRTPKELELDPYPENIRLACRYSEKIDEFDDNVEAIALDKERYWITTDDRFMRSIGLGSYWPCYVIERIQSGAEGIYSVEIFQSSSIPRTRWDEQGIRRIIKRFPRKSMIFRPRGMSSDHYLHGVFRQPLGLSDDMIVKQWIA